MVDSPFVAVAPTEPTMTTTTVDVTSAGVVWRTPGLDLTFGLEAGVLYLSGARTDHVELAASAGMPLVNITTVGGGHQPASDRLVHTDLSSRLTFSGSRGWTDGRGWHHLELSARDTTGLSAQVHLSTPRGLAAVRVETTVVNDTAAPLVLTAVATAAFYLGARPGRENVTDDWILSSARADWLAESRWSSRPLRGGRLVPLSEWMTGHNPRGEDRFTSHGTWSTGRHLPMGIASSTDHGAAWGWQIEHNGGWRWEVGQDTTDAYVAMSGPTDADHHWSLRLDPGATHTTVPATLALGRDVEDVLAELTAYRRQARRAHPDNLALPVVFNDYMNTLNGDPTTERLIPLVDAAADVGAEIFCVDAGWYADGDWWDSVGEWTPSTSRFPGGLDEVLHRIRERGMVPGLWLEPEVVGVRSPVAARLPDEAFLSRHGQRVVEHGRYHLDLRHPAARAHLDEVVDRLVDGWGVGYLKLDYNINPGPGTDVAAHSPGDGLLQHNRAHLAWLDAVLDRHPHLVVENCASGAMRADPALLSRVQLQSTSDQQDYVRYPPIAASAPASMAPEQAASWAYPQPEMDEETVAFCLVTGLLGRFFLSGYLNRMTPSQLALVRDAVAAAKRVRQDIVSTTPTWPLGLPGWDDPVVVLGLGVGDEMYLSVWDRSRSGRPVEVPLHRWRGRDVDVEVVFPRTLPTWRPVWSSDRGVLELTAPGPSIGARTFHLRVARPDEGPTQPDTVGVHDQRADA